MKYSYDNGHTYEIDDDGQSDLLANFVATITKEIRYVDGRNTETVLTIEGEAPSDDPASKELRKLPAIDVDATAFAAMSWVMPNWGVQAVIRPGSGVKDSLRTAIQLHSKPELQTVYKHIGWAKIGTKDAYIHSGGAITKTGNDPSVTVKLPPELSKYDLRNTTPIVEAITATLALAKLTKPETTWPLLAATFAPLFGPVDFGIHVTGRTGTFKSELMSLFQSFYGAGMDSRNLPGSWSSTANALEAQAFLAKNAPFVVDDFVPTGTSWQQRAYQTNADKLIRSQGNQAGRARLTDTSTLQTTMYPRGIVMSTGEDTPEGHSVRARLLIIELSPGDIDPKSLSAAQANRGKYSAVTAALAQHIATEGGVDLTPEVNTIRAKNLEIGHTRTPGMLAKLIATIHYVLDWMEFTGAISQAQAKKSYEEATKAIIAQGNQQAQYLEASDPTDLFISGIRQAIASGLGHIRSLNDGIPKKAEILGWTKETSMTDMPTWKSRGPLIGWIDWNEDTLYLDMTQGYTIVRKAAGNEITLTKQTLLKRLKDAGKLVRTEESRQRNTVRVMAGGHARQVIALAASTALDTQEVPSDE